MMRKSKNILLFCLAGLLLLAIGAFAGSFFATRKYQTFIDGIHYVREKSDKYSFVQPLLGVSMPNALTIGQFEPLVAKLKSIAQPTVGKGVSRYSVYFRDLTDGHWAGINEAEEYNPASLLKLALAVAIYKEAESKPAFLSESRVYSSRISAITKSLEFGSSTALKIGQSYTIDTLVKMMIIDSDNGAKDLLADSVDPHISDEVWSDLGIPLPEDASYTISARRYSFFLRVLYSATYLSPDYSEKLLMLLSKASYNDGLRSGVPETIPLAHKFGEHVSVEGNGQNDIELHDCGIVYAPARSYLLCVMTEGNDLNGLQKLIASVSKAVYEEVQGDYRK